MDFLSEFYLEWRITLIGKNKFYVCDKEFKIKDKFIYCGLEKSYCRDRAELIRFVQKSLPMPETAGSVVEKPYELDKKYIIEKNIHLVEDWGIYSEIPSKKKRKITHPFKWTP